MSLEEEAPDLGTLSKSTLCRNLSVSQTKTRTVFLPMTKFIWRQESWTQILLSWTMITRWVSVPRRPKASCNSRLDPKFGRCLFLKSAMFNNHCVPNCVRRVVSGTIEIIAVRWLFRLKTLLLFWDNYEDISTSGRLDQARSCLFATRTSCCRHLSDKKYF